MRRERGAGSLALLGILVFGLGLVWLAWRASQARRPRAEAPQAVSSTEGRAQDVAHAAGAQGRDQIETTEPASDDGSLPATTTEGAGTTLELEVLRADGIARDARAWLVAGSLRELPELHPPPPGLAPTFAEADEEGVLRFTELAPGPYRVALELDDLRLEQPIRLLPERPTTRLFLRLGSTTVEGFVYDEEGEPSPDALVHLARPGYGRNPPPYECFVRTDVNGFYRLRQVASGLQAIGAYPGGSLASSGAERECVVPASGTLRLDFGTPAHESVLWSGVARNLRGEPVPGPGELRLRGQGDERRAQALQADGSFELRLRPGQHHVWIQPAGFFPEQVDLGEIDVPVGGLQQDLVLPGARLRLRLSLPGEPEAAPAVSLRERNQGRSLQKLVALADGSLVRDGLAPGEYLLDAAPLVFVESGSSEYSFTLAAGRGELELGLVLRR